MLLSTLTLPLSKKFGDEKAIELIATAGFDAYDISLTRLVDADYALNCENYVSVAKSLRKFADKLGIVCNQSHAPYPSSKGDEKWDEERFELIVKAMEIAAILGAKIIVVHPKQHLRYSDENNKFELFRMNVDFYKRLVPYCEKFGIKVATENMWQRVPGTNKIVHAPCSHAEEFSRYIDAVGSEWIVGCLDIGHLGLVDEPMYEAITTLGHERLQAIHLHDNDYLNDQHTLPFMSKTDFGPFIEGLKDIDYTGDMTFETDNFLHNVPDDFLPTALKFMEQTGRYFIKKLEK